MTSKQPFLHVCDQPVYFQEDWGAGIGGGLWSTGAALAKYLDSPHAARQMPRRSHPATAMLELGSGNGLLAACWLALVRSIHHHHEDNMNAPPHTVVVTDTAEHLPLVRQTLDANPHLVDGMNVHVTEHLWGGFDDDNTPINKDPALQRTFDYIVGSDVAYRRELYEPLITSLQHFCAPHTVILLGCTMVDTTPRFFDLLREGGFSYRRLADHVMPEGYRGQKTFGIFIVQRVKRS